ncbi:hypothetical protein FA95DRAFT_422678 [Auriscalpium vulgare]|uniref:Uncharacterized protein n=1 Tax=Auriscalpium vulgare TaxID=40419 RepID=A0ACB8S4L5_9AGAM|nr:hypothetical protein FA95DRAFT_422678 [Auriscalpium vulgare]
MQTAVYSGTPSAMQASWPRSSPVQRLSTDVLQLIFEMGTTEEEGLSYGPIFPVLVSHVSREWRAIALGTPTLWTLITMADRRPVPELELSRACIARSQRCSLTVNVDFMGASHDRRLRAICLLMNVSHRVRRLNARLDHGHVAMHVILATLGRRMPLLEHFYIENPHRMFTRPADPSWVPWSDPKHCVVQQPCLTSLVVIGVSLDWNRCPMANLVHLTISSLPPHMRPSFRALASMVQASAHTLESLTIEAGAPITESATWALPEAVELPRLQDLKLGYFEPEESAVILNLFTFPALRLLKLQNLQMDLVPEGLRDQFPSHEMPLLEQLLFRARFMPNVSTLQLSGVFFDSTHASGVQLLSSFPNLQTLHIEACCNALVEALALPPQPLPGQTSTSLPPIVAPNLRELVVFNMPFSLPSNPLLHRFELARSRGLAPPLLKTVGVCNTYLKLSAVRENRMAELGMYAENVDLTFDRHCGEVSEEVAWDPQPALEALLDAGFETVVTAMEVDI